MTKKKQMTAGESMLAGAKQALAFAHGEKEHGYVVHIPEEIDVVLKPHFHKTYFSSPDVPVGPS